MNINEIKPNPNNPRIIKDDKFKKLVKSIQDFPQMLELRPIVIDKNNIVLGGNMRLKACKEAGGLLSPCTSHFNFHLDDPIPSVRRWSDAPPRMVFSSHIFIYCFLPLTLLGYLLLRHQPTRQRNLWLALTGYTFYGWAEPAFVLLMFATTSLDWFLSLVIAKDQWTPWALRKPVSTLPKHGTRSRCQKQAITLSITSNLAALALFKYGNLS